jgi:hypothetical protein
MSRKRYMASIEFIRCFYEFSVTTNLRIFQETEFVYLFLFGRKRKLIGNLNRNRNLVDQKHSETTKTWSETTKNDLKRPKTATSPSEIKIKLRMHSIPISIKRCKKFEPKGIKRQHLPSTMSRPIL